MVGMRVARHDDVEPLDPQRRELGGDLILVGTAVDQHRGAAGLVTSAASPCPTSKNRTVSDAGAPTPTAVDHTRRGSTATDGDDHPAGRPPAGPQPSGERHEERGAPRPARRDRPST